jgi:glycosyltransferase involved in cell wall biosynthesis
MSDETFTERVSIVVPMLNEVEHVEALVEDIARQDIAGSPEVLVADGRSTDGSPEVLRRAAERAGLDLTIVDNPGRRVSTGLNRCVRLAAGDVIVRMDCHTRYPPDYLRRCVTALFETGAWNVGGQISAHGRTRMERAVACAMDSPFGGIGWRPADAGAGRRDVGNVPFGAFRAEAFAAAGLYDESLLRNQDHDLNVRILAAGGRIVLDPEIRVHYVPRGSLRAVARQYYEYGLWKTTVARKHRRVINARSVAAPAFVASLLGLAAASIASQTARRALVAELAIYTACSVAFGFAALRGRREPVSLLPRVLAVFPTFHVAYGVGAIRALVRPPALPASIEALDEEGGDAVGLPFEREPSRDLQPASDELVAERGVVDQAEHALDERGTI